MKKNVFLNFPNETIVDLLIFKSGTHRKAKMDVTPQMQRCSVSLVAARLGRECSLLPAVSSTLFNFLTFNLTVLWKLAHENIQALCSLLGVVFFQQTANAQTFKDLVGQSNSVGTMAKGG